ncbi:MAG: ferrous iron transport protein A [Clostridia bacterium]|nr:ferrous iron transport protein A [Clostridia bacterium]
MTTKVNRLQNLSFLSPGDEGTISSLSHPSEGMTRRLRELGFTEDETVRCVGVSPGGGMKAYSVLGAVIALRDVDAVHVRLKSPRLP